MNMEAIVEANKPIREFSRIYHVPSEQLRRDSPPAHKGVAEWFHDRTIDEVERCYGGYWSVFESRRKGENYTVTCRCDFWPAKEK